MGITLLSSNLYNFDNLGLKTLPKQPLAREENLPKLKGEAEGQKQGVSESYQVRLSSRSAEASKPQEISPGCVIHNGAKWSEMQEAKKIQDAKKIQIAENLQAQALALGYKDWQAMLEAAFKKFST